MDWSKSIQATNSLLLAIFTVYLIGRGDIGVDLISIPFVSSSKYLFLSGKPDISPEENQWAHYLAWFITTPIMLWVIFRYNHLPLSTILPLLLVNQLMIVSGYVAQEQTDPEKLWNWFFLGCFAFLPLVYQLLSLEKGIPMIILTLVTWSLYPIAWAFPRLNLISLPVRNLIYSILDFTSKAGLVLLYLLETGKLKV
jgi:bacteriorhodopsin